jgi:hypothetical protein
MPISPSELFDLRHRHAVPPAPATKAAPKAAKKAPARKAPAKKATRARKET